MACNANRKKKKNIYIVTYFIRDFINCNC
ncbi:unnamed protein product [Nezara viridula]|uniref:Uncharacterized protein n=1 Tax=Nezara viridula TaxID=85310 RepID=A0A9P0H7C2_NEZVI|nr:unnamed protein product [Nezara viridula]